MEVKNVDPKLQTYPVVARNGDRASEMKMDVVMAPCNGCYHNLKKAEYDLAHDPKSVEVVDQLSKKAGHATYQSGQVETIHALDWIKLGLGEEGLKKRLRNSLKGSRSPTTTAACTRGRATSSPRRTGDLAASRPRSLTSWTTCWPPQAP